MFKFMNFKIYQFSWMNIRPLESGHLLVYKFNVLLNFCLFQTQIFGIFFIEKVHVIV